MKNFLIFSFLFCTGYLGFGQTVSLNSQGAIDAFVCQSSIHSLQIGSALDDSDIFDISKLACITNLYGGGLAIVNNPNLKSLHGLENISQIHGALIVQNNDSLINLIGLPQSYTCTEPTDYWRYISIIQNDQLTSLEGFPYVPNLDQIGIGGNLSLQSLAHIPYIQGLNSFGLSTNHLTDLSDLPAFDTIYEKLTITASELTSLKGLDSLKFCQEIVFENTNALTNFEGLSSLDSVRRFEVTDCDNLVDFTGMNHLRVIDHQLEITNNSNLVDFTGMNEIQRIGWLDVIENPKLKSFNGLQNLSHLKRIKAINCTHLASIDEVGDPIAILDIEHCDNLLHINRVQSPGATTITYNKRLKNYGSSQSISLPHTATNIEITHNDSLTSVVGLLGVEKVANHLILYGNPKLGSLLGLDSLTHTGAIFFKGTNISSLLPLSKLDSIDFKLSIPDNLGKIQTLEGLENLSYIKYGFRAYNKNLKDISALIVSPTYSGYTFTIRNCDSLNSTLHISNIYAPDFVKIYDNPSIKEITGFSDIDSLHQGLRISNNKNLERITGLKNLKYLKIGDPSSIKDNPNLTNISGLCPLFTEGTIDGTIDIHDNAPGFNSVQEIIEWCMTPTENLPTYDAISVYPNPSSDAFQIEVPQDLIQVGMMVDLVDISGTSHFSARLHDIVSRISVSDLPPGLYFLRIVFDGRMVQVKKLVVEK